ncbi:MAG TPA: hypothetical protein VEI02_01420, partial [Planctomycetota bacterium]|nr:hypothetical protein [Planctomycetota bacterium]
MPQRRPRRLVFAALAVLAAAASAQKEPAGTGSWGADFGPEPPSPVGQRLDWDLQDSIAAADRRGAAWLAKNPGWRVVYDQATRLPWRAYGPGVRVTTSGALRDAVERAAEAVAAELHRDFDLPGDAWRLRHAALAGRIWYVSFDALVGGVRVYDAGLSLRIDVEGRLVMWGGRFVPLAGYRGDAILTAADAQTLAVSRLRAAGLVDGRTTLVRKVADLVAFASLRTPGAPARLAWRLRLSADAPRAEWEQFVDARDGATLDGWNDVRRCGACAAGAPHAHDRTPTRGVRPPYAPWIPLDLPPARAAVSGTVVGAVHFGVPPHLPAVVMPFEGCTLTVGGVPTVTDAAGAYAFTGGGATVSVSSLLDGPWISTNNAATGGAQATFVGSTGSGVFNLTWDATNSLQEERDAFFFANRARSTMLLRNPSETLFNTLLPANLNVTGSCNAYYDGTSINFFPPGGGCINTAFSGTVVEHEYGHHVSTTIWWAHGRVVPGHLGEGFSDAQAGACEDTSVVGDGFSGVGTFVRDMNNTCQWPMSCGSGVHARGKVIGGCYWHTRTQFDAAYGAAGKAQFDEYLYQHFHGAPMTETESCLDFLVLNDDDANLANGTPDLPKFVQGFTVQHAVPFPMPLLQIAHAPLGHQCDQLQAVQVRATVASLTGGAITSALLYYNVNGGAFTPVAMTFDGAEWSASIPVQAGFAAVGYYLSFADGTGNVATSPRGAPAATHVYRNYRPVVFYSDGFESPAGWS